MRQSFHDYIREYQDSHDCSDDDMLRILCDALEDMPNIKLRNALDKLKESLPIDEPMEEDDS